MVISNHDIMMSARDQLRGKWGSAILAGFIYFLLIAISGSAHIIGCIIGLIVDGPITYGLCYYFLSFSRNKNPVLEDLFKGFSLFSKTFVAYILIVIFVALWSILLIIPGIIAAISYSMTFFIMADNQNLSGQDAIRKSKELMNGNKYRYFCLLCRFIGWFLLCILSLGIGFLWLIPYFNVSNAKFYNTLINSEINQTDSFYANTRPTIE